MELKRVVAEKRKKFGMVRAVSKYHVFSPALLRSTDRREIEVGLSRLETAGQWICRVCVRRRGAKEYAAVA